MSTCLCTVGHHNLITDSPEIVARQLSDIYDINIEYGSYDDEFGNSQGTIVKHEGAPLYKVWGSTDERGPWYDVSGGKNVDGDAVPFSFITISKNIIGIDLFGWPYCYMHYWEVFRLGLPVENPEMEVFRRKLKRAYRKFGIDTVYCFAENYVLDNNDDLPWPEFEDLLYSGKYMGKDYSPKHLEDCLINVSDYITGKNRKAAPGSIYDVFIDDFSDLD